MRVGDRIGSGREERKRETDASLTSCRAGRKINSDRHAAKKESCLSTL